MKINISEFTIYADSDNDQHCWYIGSSDSIDKDDFSKRVDQKLCELNDDYLYVRTYNLKFPKIELLPPDLFYRFLESLGKIGAQNKMPRVLNKMQAERWKDFINATSSL
jgi:hypothetical protein